MSSFSPTTNNAGRDCNVLRHGEKVPQSPAGKQPAFEHEFRMSSVRQTGDFFAAPCVMDLKLLRLHHCFQTLKTVILL
jgi:hypothetical protein